MEYVINTKKKKDDDEENGTGNGPYTTKNISGGGSLEDLAKQLRKAANENGHIAGAFMMGPDGEAIPLDASDGPESIIKSIRAELSKRLGPGKELDEAMEQVSREIRSGKLTGRMEFKGGGSKSKAEESARVSAEDEAKLGPVQWGRYNPGRRVVIESMGVTSERASVILERLAELVMLRGDVGPTVQTIEAIGDWDFREKAYAIMHMQQLRDDLERNPSVAAGRLLKSIRDDRARQAADPSFKSEVLEAVERSPEAKEKIEELLRDGYADVYDAAKKAAEQDLERESIVERVRRRKAEKEKEKEKGEGDGGS